MDSRTLDTLQGELERLFTLDQLKALSLDALGLDPAALGTVTTKGAFAKALVGYCQDQEALPALVDAIGWSRAEGDPPPLSELGSFTNGELPPGTVVGPLRILKKVGEGGLGVVYLAERQAGDKKERAALKVIRAEYARDRAAVQRFTAASRWLRKLELNGLVPIQEVGELDDARPWIAAAYMESETLAERIRREGPMPTATALPILRTVFSTLSELHARGLVHGDLKVENVFIVEPRGQSPKGVLVDAASDRLLLNLGPQSATTTGQLPVFGTPKALAPEQARGAAPNTSSEVYAAGVLIYETLTGVPPFRGDNAIDVIASHIGKTAQPPSEQAPKGAVTPALDAVILQALAKRPADRFPSIERLASALDRAARRRVISTPVTEATIEQAYHALVADPTSDSLAQQLEDLLAAAGDLGRAAHWLSYTADNLPTGKDRNGLRLRAARLFEHELNAPSEAEELYKDVLDSDGDNAQALLGLTSVRRTQRDYNGLVDVLLDRAHRARDTDERRALMREAAELHAEKRGDPRSAAQLYTDLLTEDPNDQDARRALFRLGLRDPAALEEPMARLSAVASQLARTLWSDQDEARKQATQSLLEAEARQQELSEKLEAELQQRRLSQSALKQQLEDEAEARRATHAEVRKQEREQRQGVLLHRERELVTAQERLQAHREVLSEQTSTLEQAHVDAEINVEAYENQLDAVGATADSQQTRELQRLGALAESCVDYAAELEETLSHTRAFEAELAGRVEQLQVELDDLRADAEGDDEVTRLVETDQELAQLLDEIEALDAEEVELTSEELMAWHAVETDVTRHRTLLEKLNETVQEEASTTQQKTREQAVGLRVLLGDLYMKRLKQPEMALLAYEEAFSLDPDDDTAAKGLIALHEHNHAWATLAQLHLTRAERAKSKVQARASRVAAAQVIVHRLGNLDRARTLLEQVVAEDPADSEAQELLSDVLVQQEDFPALAEQLQARIPAQERGEQVETRMLLGQLLEQLQELPDAAAQYREVLKLDREHRNAIKNLRRLAEALDDQPLLAHALKAELEVAATPKRRILLWEQLAQLEEQEFVDIDAAIDYYEQIIDLNPRHRGANRALPRLYRQRSRFMDAVARLSSFSDLVDSQAERVSLWLEAAQLLTEHDLDRPQAISLCEHILEIADEHREALTLLSRLLVKEGQRKRAVATLDRLTDQVPSGSARAEQLVRVAQLAEDAQDEDGAAQRYKRALEEDPENRTASRRLQSIYLKRGDAHGAADILRRSLAVADSEFAQSQLQAELGSLLLAELNDQSSAEHAFVSALALDPTNAVATAGLGKVALQQGDRETAAEHFQTALKRLGGMSPTQAAEVCAMSSDLYAERQEWEPAIELLRRAREFDPADRKILQRLATVLATAGEQEQALRLYQEFLLEWSAEQPSTELQQHLLRVSELQRATGRDEEARATLRRALSLGHREEVLGALVDLCMDSGAHADAVEVLQEWLVKVHEPASRHRLLTRIGDILSEQLADFRTAAQHYSMALDERPKDRQLLGKLTQLYNRLRDWPQLIEVNVRSATAADNPSDASKHYLAAANIALKELQRYDEAANYLSKALPRIPFEEGRRHFADLCDCLTHNQDWERLERAYDQRFSQFADDPEVDPNALAELLRARARVLQQHLNRGQDAIALLEQTRRFALHTPESRAQLLNLYARQPERYLAQAVALHRAALNERPLEVRTLRALRRVYTSAKRPDESYCMCQALHALQAAEGDERRFYEKYRLQGLPRFRHPLNEELFREFVLHPAQDPLLTAIFAALSPAIIATYSAPHTHFRLTPERRVDPQADRNPLARLLAHAGHTLGQPLPSVFRYPEADALLSLLTVSPPAIGLGRRVPANIPQHALAFVAARHTSYYRAGHLPRQLSPSGAALQGWLVASFCMVIPGFAVPANMERQVNDNLQAIRTHLSAPQQDMLRGLSQKLSDASSEPDLHRWLSGVEFTADRVGFILSNDLLLARDALELNPQGGFALPRPDRERELLSYAVSDAYFELRKRLGIALGG